MFLFMVHKRLKYKVLILTPLFFILMAISLLAENVSVNFPGLFMKNQGQFNNGSEYCLKAKNTNTFFFNQHIVNQFISTGSERDSANLDIVNMQVDFENSNPNVVFEERNQMDSKSNFFIGNDPSKWQTDIASFGTLAYKNLYNHIDLVYYNETNGIKSDFVVHTGGKISDIVLKYSGIKTIFINNQGELVLGTDAGELKENIPEAYQIINGIKVLVKADFSIESGNKVGFSVSGYDPDYDLIIDPQLVYCTYLGGSNDDQFFHGNMVTDTQGNIYLAAKTKSFDFPIIPGSYSSTFNGLYDVVVFKFNPAATQLLFSTYVGGGSDDCPYGIALSGSANDVVVAGWTRGSGFPVTSGVFQGTFAGGSSDGFILKLNNTGNNLIFSTYIGSLSEDYISDIEIDATSNIFIAGYSSSNFPTTSGSYQPTNTNTGSYDIIVSKLNSTGSSLLASTMIGGLSHDRGHDIALDNSGFIYISGSAEGNLVIKANA